MRIGGTLEGQISGIGKGISGDFMAEVARVTEDGALGLRWLELDPRVFLVLSGQNIK